MAHPKRPKNQLEPILFTLAPGASSELDEPHEGEEFGYVLSGLGTLHIGGARHKLRKNGSFYYKPTAPHYIENRGRSELKIIWVSTPPSF